MFSEAELAQRTDEITQQAEFHDMLKQMMYEVNTRRSTATSIAHVGLSFLTAPLLTLSTSLAVSQPANRVTLESFEVSKGAGGSARTPEA